MTAVSPLVSVLICGAFSGQVFGSYKESERGDQAQASAGLLKGGGHQCALFYQQINFNRQ